MRITLGEMDEASFKEPLLEDEVNFDVSPSSNKNSESKQRVWEDSSDVSLDISRLENSDSNGESWCPDWGFAELPEIIDLSPVDPFRNSSYSPSGVYEWLKMILCTPLMIIRVLMILLALAFGFVFTKLALCGWEPNQKAMPRWRRNIMWGTRACARAILFCFGFHWIKRVGRAAPREVAPIVVCNHVSFMDPMFFFYELFPTIVSSSSHNDMMFVGTIIQAMQVVLVDRSSPESRKEAVNEIKRRASQSEFPRVLLFPEGTTTNGRALISFKPGAFVPGYPVQPVVVSYPHVHLDASWGNISLASLLPRMLLQFHNFMQVQYLPVVYPSSHEKSQPRAFAERVRNSMAKNLGVPDTEHSYGDLELCSKALALRMPHSMVFTLEMRKLETQLQLSIDGALQFLEKFAEMNSSRSGSLSRSEFLQNLGLCSSSFGNQVFAFFDRKGHNSVDFQEFVTSSLCLSRHEDFTSLTESTFELLDTDKDQVLLLDEVEKTLQTTFPAKASEFVRKLCGSEDCSQMDLSSFRKHLCRNPELLFILSLGVKNRLQQLRETCSITIET